MKKALGFFLLCLLAATLNGCGKKASDVVLSDDGAVTDHYPGTYPDAGSDKPGTYLPSKAP